MSIPSQPKRKPRPLIPEKVVDQEGAVEEEEMLLAAEAVAQDPNVVAFVRLGLLLLNPSLHSVKTNPRKNHVSMDLLLSPVLPLQRVHGVSEESRTRQPRLSPFRLLQSQLLQSSRRVAKNMLIWLLRMALLPLACLLL